MSWIIQIISWLFIYNSWHFELIFDFFLNQNNYGARFLHVFFGIFNLKFVLNILNKAKNRNHLLFPQNFQISLDTILICLYIILIRWQTFNLYDFVSTLHRWFIGIFNPNKFPICIPLFKMPSNAKCKLILI